MRRSSGSKYGSDLSTTVTKNTQNSTLPDLSAAEYFISVEPIGNA